MTYFNWFGRASAAGFAMIMLASGAGMAGEVNNDGGAAIQGYDVVAYFTDHKPVRGKPDFVAQYKGATFQFASAAHRDTFTSDPARYAPQFGGFCSYAASRGYKASVDPAAFDIVAGKLYLNYNKQVQVTWKKDIPGYIQKAEQNWPVVSKLEP